MNHHRYALWAAEAIARKRYQQSLREAYKAQLRYEQMKAWAREANFYLIWGFLCAAAVRLADILLS